MKTFNSSNAYLTNIIQDESLKVEILDFFSDKFKMFVKQMSLISALMTASRLVIYLFIDPQYKL